MKRVDGIRREKEKEAQINLIIINNVIKGNVIIVNKNKIVVIENK